MRRERQGKKVTLADIADQVKCSLQAVSSVLNPASRSTTSVGPETSERIRVAARSLGYRVRWKEKPAKGRRCRIVFILESGASCLPFLMHKRSPFSRLALQWRYEAQLWTVGSSPNGELLPDYSDLFAYLDESQVDAIVCLHHTSEQLRQYAKRKNLPLVWVNPNQICENNCLLHDDTNGAEMAMRTLHLAGITHIAYLGGLEHPSCLHHTIQLRQDTVLDCARRYNMQVLYRPKKYTSPVEQAREIADLDYSGRLMVVAYGDEAGAEEIVCSGPRHPTERDLFCLCGQYVRSEPPALPFGYLRLHEESLCEQALMRVFVMLHTGARVFANIAFPEELVLRRLPFSQTLLQSATSLTI